MSEHDNIVNAKNIIHIFFMVYDHIEARLIAGLAIFNVFA